MAKIDEIHHRILDLFYGRGIDEVTPTYVAYALRIAPGKATEALDSMVKASLLELETDGEGNITYRLPESERRRIRESSTPDNPPSAERARGDRRDESSVGFDGSIEGQRTASNRRSVENGAHSVRQPVRGTVGPQQGQGPRAQAPRREHSYSEEQFFANEQLVRRQTTRPSERVDGNPMVAAALSLVIPGMGQIYNQDVGKGALMFFSWIIALFLWIFWIVNIWSSFDAYQAAQRNKALEDRGT